MATGIVSIALVIDGDLVLSRATLAIALSLWIVLAAVFLWRAWSERPRFRAEAHSPTALTAVAATAVIGSRFLDLGWPGPAAAMLVFAAGLWVALIAPVLRAVPDRGPGVLFMLTVSTESVAVLAAALAAPDHAPLLEYLALPLAAIGLALYGLTLCRFDPRELLEGRGDHWISGGALAITTLASSQITLTAAQLNVLGGRLALQDVTLALWASAVAWLPVLIAAELLRPLLRYDPMRWATVFPLGMYGVCTSTAATAVGIPVLSDLARAWTWVALAAWAAVALGLLRRRGLLATHVT
jgi:hypothetical protein